MLLLHYCCCCIIVVVASFIVPVWLFLCTFYLVVYRSPIYDVKPLQVIVLRTRQRGHGQQVSPSVSPLLF